MLSSCSETFEQNPGFDQVSSSHAALWLQLTEDARRWIIFVFHANPSQGGCITQITLLIWGMESFQAHCLMSVQHVSPGGGHCGRAPWLCGPLCLVLLRVEQHKFFAHFAFQSLSFAFDFWELNQTSKKNSEPPGFTCFHNKTRRWSEFAVERFRGLSRSFPRISGSCEHSGHRPYLVVPICSYPAGGRLWWETKIWSLCPLWETHSALTLENVWSAFPKVIIKKRKQAWQ